MTPKIIKGDWCNKSDEVFASQNEPFIFINSNGSRWAGQEAADIPELLEVLRTYKLRKDMGPYIDTHPCQGVYNPKFRYNSNEPQYIDGNPLFSNPDVVHFSGNFENLSHVFSIYTNDLDTITALTTAIRENA